jgi:hypothetical protein
MQNVASFILDAESWRKIIFAKNENLAKYVTQSNQSPIRTLYEVRKKVDVVQKTADSANDTAKAIKAGNLSGLGKTGQILGSVTRVVSTVASIVGAATGVFNTITITEILNGDDSNFVSKAGEARRLFSLLGKTQARISALEKQTKINDANQKVTGLRAQQAFTNSVTARELAQQSRKLGNDALYEARVGRKLLEEKITAINKFAQKSISDIRSEFQKQVDKISANLKAQALRPQVQVATKEDIGKLAVDIQKVNIIVNRFPSVIQRTFNTTQSTIKQVVDKAITPLAKIGDAWGVTVTPATVTPATVTPSDGGAVTITPATVTPATVTPAMFSSSAIGQRVTQQIKQETSGIDTKINVLANAITNVGTASQQGITNVNADLQNTKKALSKTDISTIDNGARLQIEQLKRENQLQTQEITKLTQNLQSEQKVNQDALNKLNQINLGITGLGVTVMGIQAGLSALPSRTASQIVPQIAPIVDNTICNSANGGCLGNALNQNANNVGNAINSGNNDLWNKINAGLNGLSLGADSAVMGILNTINGKLGDLIPNGGIAGKLVSGFKWLQIDRVMNLLALATSLHNAWMLSNNVVQTCTQILSNILATMGLKDENGAPFNISEIVNGTVENFVKSTIGEENYKQTTETMAKANRIYQAGINVLNAVQNLNSLILNALEIVGSHVALIGNALKAAGVVAERAYKWFNPSPDFENPWMARLEKLDQVANTVQMVTQVPVDISNAITEVNRSATDLVKAVKGEEETAKEGIDAQIPDYKKLREEQEKAKNQSKSPSISLFNIFKGS